MAIQVIFPFSYFISFYFCIATEKQRTAYLAVGKGFHLILKGLSKKKEMGKIFQDKDLNTNGVDRKSVEQLSNYLTNTHLPFVQTLRFRWNKEVMQVNYQLRYGHKNLATITNPASFELAQTLIIVLAANSSDALLDYLKSDDLGEVILNDERLDLFYQFLESDSKGEIRSDWIGDSGTRYACVNFQLAKMRSVDFCLPKNVTVQGALKNMGCPFDKEALTLPVTNN